MAYSVLKSKAFSSVVVFLSSLIVIRALPKDEYGLYILTLVFFSFFNLILTFLDSSFVRFISASGKQQQHRLVASILSIKISITFAILISFVFLYDFSVEVLNISAENLTDFKNLYLIISIGFIFKCLATTIIALLNSYKLYNVLLKLTILRSLATLAVALFVLLFELNVWQYVLLSVILTSIYAIVSMYKFYQQKKYHTKRYLI